ncbi:MAG: DNA helicase RecQ [Defluviitaleaceae bacterium]|nr:DNA helicase RecQ [Defluviitaleaceae bacterium]
MTAREVLKQNFGYSEFRAGQEELVGAILSGQDALGIMPTGAGKSLCFQVPGLMFGGITLIVSPLISLMKDQVNALVQEGIAAAYINSSLTERQVARALENAAGGMYKLIYIAPERLLTSEFLHFAHHADIAMLTVDEAHCISQWGQDFRPSYTAIPAFIAQLQRRPVVSAFTATATPSVRDDIVAQLQMKSPQVLISGFDRPNLYFDLKNDRDKYAALLAFLAERRGSSGIVYCATRATVEEVCESLCRDGYVASRYHAGLSDDERHGNQDDFLYDRALIMVATNAFGMGIDKSNVSFVVHYNMPKDIEGYYQEAGRAGRDGEPANCLLLYSRGDVQKNMWMINNASDADETIKARNIERLHIMERLCTTSECLRKHILEYFGESTIENCGNCINCETEFIETNITPDAQQIISCVTRMGERFGAKMVADVLRGMNNAKVQSFKLNKFTTFGISKKSAVTIAEMIDFMISEEYLIKTAEKFPIIKLGSRAKEALQADAAIIMRGKKSGGGASNGETSNSYAPRVAKTFGKHAVNTLLLAALKELRLRIAREQKLPAFVIFHDSTLTDMCMKLPTTIDALLEVSGVGKVKADKYGAEFVAEICKFIK